MQKIPLIDTHTGGEPTRVVFADRFFTENESTFRDDPTWKFFIRNSDPVAVRNQLRDHADWIRRSLVNEPRGGDFMVGAWVSSAADPDNLASVVFFNNVGYLGMCGHGLIGVVEAMRYTGRVAIGRHRIETPAGIVAFTLHEDHSVTFDNVPSYRDQTKVSVSLSAPSAATQSGLNGDCVVGDIAYGGNWFFLVDVPSIELKDSAELLRYCLTVRDALRRHGITGRDGAEIDHIELGSPLSTIADQATNSAEAADDLKHPIRGGRNFVLCPGGHYDRSPCGTGTSAKVACLAADGKLSPDEVWTQESIVGSRFEASYRLVDGEPGGSRADAEDRRIIASVRGRAFVTAETVGVLDPDDPFCTGISINPKVREQVLGVLETIK